jgi:hypothetical protein
MRKLIESTFVSLDGIISDTQPSTASRAEPQHWGQPYWDEEHGGYAGKLLERTGAPVWMLTKRRIVAVRPGSSSFPEDV